MHNRFQPRIRGLMPLLRQPYYREHVTASNPATRRCATYLVGPIPREDLGSLARVFALRHQTSNATLGWTPNYTPLASGIKARLPAPVYCSPTSLAPSDLATARSTRQR
jgi:hypothetical protein